MKQVCALNLAVSMSLEEISEVQSKMSHDVAHSILNHSCTTGNVHASAMLVLWNLVNVEKRCKSRGWLAPPFVWVFLHLRRRP